MAIVQGIREKVHLPIYDSLQVEPEKQRRAVESSSTLKFFVNVQGKTKLDTETTTAAGTEVTGDFELGLDRLMDLLKEARASEDGFAALPADDDDVTLFSGTSEITAEDDIDAIANLGGTIWLSVADLEGYIEDLEKDSPPLEQIRSNDGAGNIISKFIYNSVTTFYVGEKVMIEMPTWNFPGGTGAWSLGGNTVSHGEPSPLATFRFAEPIYIDKQQNFRVEIEIPDAEVLKEIQKIYGPLFIWVVLDGYLPGSSL